MIVLTRRFSRVYVNETEISPTIEAASGGGGMNLPMVLAIHEADGQNVTVQKEVAYSLVTGGGKPGQGYPCVMIYDDTDDNK